MPYPQIFPGNDNDPAEYSAMQETTMQRPDKATLEAHLARQSYGRFTLTDAIRPGWSLDVVPQAGYRFDAYADPKNGSTLPAIIASVSSEQLFETFLQLIEPLGDTLDVVLESSHDNDMNEHCKHPREFTRVGVERLVLESTLWDFEDLLLHDGCSSAAVMHPELPIEVQLDEHKLLVVYANDRKPFDKILSGQGLHRNDSMRFISQGEHLHTSNTRYTHRFSELIAILGAE